MSKFAPIVAWCAATGNTLATGDELALFLADEARGGTSVALFSLDGPVFVRRLSYTDPCDQRAIVFFTALALGATEAEAKNAIFDSHSQRLYRLAICYAKAGPAWAPRVILDIEAKNDEGAYGALCAAIWGKK